MDPSALPLRLGHTAQYVYLEHALKARWDPYQKLCNEYSSFTPKTIDHFSEHRAREFVRMRALNPVSSDESLYEFIDNQITFAAQPYVQFSDRFSIPIVSEYATVALLSHALIEAAINAVLAVGLATNGTPEVFGLLERCEVKEKWLTGPKAIHASYVLNKRSALYGTLQHLVRERNAFVHNKVDVELNGRTIITGSSFQRMPMDKMLIWMHRFFSLPFDLMAHLQRKIPGLTVQLLYRSDPIERYTKHAEA
jgi:hypothetical protein